MYSIWISNVYIGASAGDKCMPQSGSGSHGESEGVAEDADDGGAPQEVDVGVQEVGT